MYCGGERRWRREIYKEKCMVGGRGGDGGGRGGPPPLIKRGTVMVEWGYSEEEGEVEDAEGEEEEEEGGRNRKMFKEEGQNWIKKKCIVEE